MARFCRRRAFLRADIQVRQGVTLGDKPRVDPWYVCKVYFTCEVCSVAIEFKTPMHRTDAQDRVVESVLLLSFENARVRRL